MCVVSVVCVCVRHHSLLVSPCRILNERVPFSIRSGSDASRVTSTVSAGILSGCTTSNCSTARTGVLSFSSNTFTETF